MRRIHNPPNPFESTHREWLDEPPPAEVHVYEESARTILSRNDSPDLAFEWTVNPYRGCQHACAYCYARPYHEYLGYGAGTDFDTRIVAKTNAPELLRAEITKSNWKHACINFSGVTDCYQPYEAVYNITRQCLEVCRDLANPIAIVTKAYLVTRDTELIAEIHDRAAAAVYISIPFADDETARLIEPYTPPPSRRLDAIRQLTAAGVPVGVLVAPIIPGLNDAHIAQILENAADAGATAATCSALRLSGTVEQVFMDRLQQAMPLRAKRIENRIRDIRGGYLSDSRFGRRMTGEGIYWDSIMSLFDVAARKAGLATNARQLINETGRPPKASSSQMMLKFE